MKSQVIHHEAHNIPKALDRPSSVQTMAVPSCLAMDLTDNCIIRQAASSFMQSFGNSNPFFKSESFPLYESMITPSMTHPSKITLHGSKHHGNYLDELKKNDSSTPSGQNSLESIKKYGLSLQEYTPRYHTPHGESHDSLIRAYELLSADEHALYVQGFTIPSIESSQNAWNGSSTNTNSPLVNLKDFALLGMNYHVPNLHPIIRNGVANEHLSYLRTAPFSIQSCGAGNTNI